MTTRRKRIPVPVSPELEAALARVATASSTSVPRYAEQLLEGCIPVMLATAEAMEQARKSQPLVALENLEAELTRILGEGAVVRREIVKTKKRVKK